MSRVVVLGAGYHGRVLARTIAAAKKHELVAFLDDDSDRQNEELAGVPIIGPLGILEEIMRERSVTHFGVGVGECHLFNDFLMEAVPQSERPLSQVGTRRAIFYFAKSAGLVPADVIHPTAHIAEPSKLGEGVYMAPHVVVHYDSAVGDNTIFFTGTTIDHDNVIGDHVFFGPGTHTAGQVTIKDGCYIGPGVTIGGGVTIGENCVVGAGAVVLNDIPAGQVAYGVPAEPRGEVSEWLER